MSCSIECCIPAVVGYVSLGVHWYWQISRSTFDAPYSRNDNRGEMNGPVRAEDERENDTALEHGGAFHHEDSGPEDTVRSSGSARTDPVDGTRVSGGAATTSVVVCPLSPSPPERRLRRGAQARVASNRVSVLRTVITQQTFRCQCHKHPG